MDWFQNKLYEIDDVFHEFPVVKRLVFFYIASAIIATIGYFPLIKALINLNLMGAYPFQKAILENLDFLVWGVFFVPLLILLSGWIYIDRLYEKLKKRKYRY